MPITMIGLAYSLVMIKTAMLVAGQRLMTVLARAHVVTSTSGGG
jgi:hypothetical protein